MRDPEVINHQDISLLPAIEDEVVPDGVPDMCDGGIRDGGGIPKLCVQPNMITPPDRQEEETEHPHEDGEKEELEFAQATPHTIIFLVYHGPVKDLEDCSIKLLCSLQRVCRYHEMVEPDSVSSDWVLLHSFHFVHNLQVSILLPREALTLLCQFPANILLAVCSKHGWPALHHDRVRHKTLLLLIVADMQNLRKRFFNSREKSKSINLPLSLQTPS